MEGRRWPDASHTRSSEWFYSCHCSNESPDWCLEYERHLREHQIQPETKRKVTLVSSRDLLPELHQDFDVVHWKQKAIVRFFPRVQPSFDRYWSMRLECDLDLPRWCGTLDHIHFRTRKQWNLFKWKNVDGITYQRLFAHWCRQIRMLLLISNRTRERWENRTLSWRTLIVVSSGSVHIVRILLGISLSVHRLLLDSGRTCVDPKRCLSRTREHRDHRLDHLWPLWHRDNLSWATELHQCVCRIQRHCHLVKDHCW